MMHERSYTPLFNLNGYESTLVTGLIYDNRRSFIRLEIHCLVKRNLMGRLHLIRRLYDWQYSPISRCHLCPLIVYGGVAILKWCKGTMGWFSQLVSTTHAA